MKSWISSAINAFHLLTSRSIPVASGTEFHSLSCIITDRSEDASFLVLAFFASYKGILRMIFSPFLLKLLDHEFDLRLNNLVNVFNHYRI